MIPTNALISLRFLEAIFKAFDSPSFKSFSTFFGSLTKSKYFSLAGAISKLINSNNSFFISLEVPKYPQNQIHFNVNELRQKLKWRDYPIDLVFCHQLEITKHLKLFFIGNRTTIVCFRFFFI